MPNWEWTSRELVFVPQMDADHQKLFEEIEKVRQAIEEENSAGGAAFPAWHLSKGLAAHCRGEERLMRRSGYPGFEWHQRQHHAGQKKMARLMIAIQARDAERTQEGLRELAEWLRDHVGLADRMFAAHLRNDVRARLVS